MEPLTLLATIVTITITGALTRVGEIVLDGTIDKFKRLIEREHPDTLQQLQAAASNPAALPETIEVMATLIENDAEVKAIAEKVAQENNKNPQVIKYMKNVGFIAEAGSNITNFTQNFN